MSDTGLLILVAVLVLGTLGGIIMYLVKERSSSAKAQRYSGTDPAGDYSRADPQGTGIPPAPSSLSGPPSPKRSGPGSHFPKQAATFSLAAPFVGMAIPILLYPQAEGNRWAMLILSLLSTLLILSGLVFGIVALFLAQRQKQRGVVGKAAVGITLCGLLTAWMLTTIRSVPHNAPAGELNVHTAGAPLEKANRVILFLHGYGDSGSNARWIHEAFTDDARTAFLFPDGPLRIGSSERAWYTVEGEGFEASRNQLISLLRNVTTNSPGCSIIVAGFSQGATMASNLLTPPGLTNVVGAVLYSPGLLLIHPPKAGETLPQVFLSHGRRDQQVPFSGSERLRKRLTGLGCTVHWMPFDGGHTVLPEAVDATDEFLTTLSQALAGL